MVPSFISCKQSGEREGSTEAQGERGGEGGGGRKSKAKRKHSGEDIDSMEAGGGEDRKPKESLLVDLT